MTVSRWPDIEAALSKEGMSVLDLKKKLKIQPNTLYRNLYKQQAAGKVVMEEIAAKPGFLRRKKIVWRLV